MPFQWEGHRIATWEAGEGQALLLIHGFPTAAWDWAPVWGDLTKSYRVLALDMLGFGLSGKPKNHPYLIAQQADLQLAFLKEKGVREVHILCHDYGVSVAQELLARGNSDDLGLLQILSCCFLNGGLFPGVHRPLLIQKLMASPIGGLITSNLSRGQLKRSFTKIFGPDTPPSEEELDGYWHLIDRDGGKAILAKLIGYMHQRVVNKDRWIGALIDTKVPLQFINGGYDPISGRHVADYYQQTIPNPRVEVLETIGHYPQVEAPSEVLQAFRGFHRVLQGV